MSTLKIISIALGVFGAILIVAVIVLCYCILVVHRGREPQKFYPEDERVHQYQSSQIPATSTVTDPGFDTGRHRDTVSRRRTRFTLPHESAPPSADTGLEARPSMAISGPSFDSQLGARSVHYDEPPVRITQIRYNEPAEFMPARSPQIAYEPAEFMPARSPQIAYAEPAEYMPARSRQIAYAEPAEYMPQRGMPYNIPQSIPRRTAYEPQYSNSPPKRTHFPVPYQQAPEEYSSYTDDVDSFDTYSTTSSQLTFEEDDRMRRLVGAMRNSTSLNVSMMNMIMHPISQRYCAHYYVQQESHNLCAVVCLSISVQWH